MSDEVNKLAVNKLTILYLLNKMDLPLTGSQISQYALERNFMDYFEVQQCLNELMDVRYLNRTKENRITRYSLTSDGFEALTHLVDIIPEHVLNDVIHYVRTEKGELQKEIDVAANYFDNKDNGFHVKCGVYDSGGQMLMELSVSVASKEHARQICRNWKTNTAVLYRDILNGVTEVATK